MFGLDIDNITARPLKNDKQFFLCFFIYSVLDDVLESNTGVYVCI